jgi:hypothetical protein
MVPLPGAVDVAEGDDEEAGATAGTSIIPTRMARKRRAPMMRKRDAKAQKTYHGRATCVLVIGLFLCWLAWRQIDHAGAGGRIGLVWLWGIAGEWIGVATATAMLWAGHGGFRPPPAWDRFAVRLYIAMGVLGTIISIVTYVVYLYGGFDSSA